MSMLSGLIAMMSTSYFANVGAKSLARQFMQIAILEIARFQILID